MTIKHLQSQRIGVLGYGQEGQAVIAYLLRHGIKPVLFDKRRWNQFRIGEQGLLKAGGIEHVLGSQYMSGLNQVDVLFRSPGIWRLAPELLAAEKNGLTVTSQVKWFFDHSPAPIIGVTGTKGKGTTASLVTHLLSASFGAGKIFLTGNVGAIQPLEILDNLDTDDLIVYELSSFQLQDLHKSPHIGVVLMVTQDHLDVHSSVDEYAGAKQAIVKFQQRGDFAIINDDYPVSKAIGQLGSGKKLYFSRLHHVEEGGFAENGKLEVRGLRESGDLSFDLSFMALRGQHNWENVSAAVLASLCAGATAENIEQALPTFQPLRHRLQHLPARNGIKFYNDSFSTVPETAVAAIRSFTEPLIVILGGSDKGADFSALAEEITKTPNIKAIAAIGVTGSRIAQALANSGFSKLLLEGFNDLAETMAAIKTITSPGDVVLLSPACASFDWYVNYKERGEDFIKLADQWQAL